VDKYRLKNSATIKRVLKINDLKEITVEVVEAARDCLVIGEI